MVSGFISAIVSSGGVIDKVFTVKCQQDFPTGHIFQTAIRSCPVRKLVSGCGKILFVRAIMYYLDGWSIWFSNGVQFSSIFGKGFLKWVYGLYPNVH